MKRIQTDFKAWLMIVLMLSACAAGVMAETVQVQGEADVTEIYQKIDQLTAEVAEVAKAQQANADAIVELKAQLAEDQQDDNTDTDPTSRGGVIGMNSGFVWRNNYLHPDNPAEDGYADLLKPVCSVYRPMNWNRINDYTKRVESIDDPHHYKDKTWRDAINAQLDVCDAVGSGYYLNVPLDASDDWVREAVALARQRLGDRVLYVAWANEVWNTSFATYHWVKQQSGTDAGAGDGNPFFNLWADRLDEVFAAAREADPACIRVVETKTADDGIWWLEAVVNKMSGGYDAVAGTLYFGAPKYWGGMTSVELMSSAEDEWRNDDVKWQNAWIKWAKDRDLLAIAYEGGQHYQQYGYEALTRSVQDDPHTQQMYGWVYGNAIDQGVDLILDFDWIDWDNSHGHFGKASSLKGVPGSSKYQTVKAIAEANSQ